MPDTIAGTPDSLLERCVASPKPEEFAEVHLEGPVEFVARTGPSELRYLQRATPLVVVT